MLDQILFGKYFLHSTKQSKSELSTQISEPLHLKLAKFITPQYYRYRHPHYMSDDPWHVEDCYRDVEKARQQIYLDNFYITTNTKFLISTTNDEPYAGKCKESGRLYAVMYDS